MKITIETKDNPNRAGVAEGLQTHITLLVEGNNRGVPYSDTLMDEPCCCAGCAVQAALAKLMIIHARANLPEPLRTMLDNMQPPPNAQEGEEWKTDK